MVFALPSRSEVKVSRRRQFLPPGSTACVFLFNMLRMAAFLHYTATDEVARNGVLQRITSARGFL